jgi:hypothetical protein
MKTLRWPILLGFLWSAWPAVAQDKAPRSGAPGTVTLPLAEYDRLVERAAHPPDVPDQAPVAAVLSSATLALRVEGRAVRGTMELAGEVFRPGSVRLFDGQGLLDATQGGRPVPLRMEGGAPHAVVTQTGRLALTLHWADQAVAEPGRASFTVPVPPAGTARATIDLPGPDLDASVAPGAVTRRSSIGGRTLLEVALDPGQPARVSWTVGENAALSASPRETRFLSDLKTLVTTAEADLRLTTLVDLTIVQGEPSQVDVKLPVGFELVGVSGATLEASQPVPGGVRLMMREPARRRHQLLLNLERAAGDGSFRADLTMPTLPAAQRETGEVALEGVGTLELSAREAGSLRRIDVGETSAPLRALAREPVLAAFRYHRRPDETPSLAVEVKRFPNAAVLAALAERASVTTLVTTQGRTLTELALTVRNQAQPFLRVTLPEGATLLSAEVAGQGVKPVTGTDGTRIPLLRPGFRPTGPYAVSFVYLQPGSAFAKKGEAALTLPRLDLPVSVLEWELFLPERYRVKPTGGDVLPGDDIVLPASVTGQVGPPLPASGPRTVYGTRPLRYGEIGGVVTDHTGAVVPGATVTLQGPAGTKEAVTDGDGAFVFSDLAPAKYSIRSSLSGFKTTENTVTFAGPPRPVALRMSVGGLEETITVEAEAPAVQTSSTTIGSVIRSDEHARSFAASRRKNEPEAQPPSANVVNLQKRVAGVLPVRLDVPHAGTSYRFFRPLVVDEETTVRFAYKRR